MALPTEYTLLDLETTGFLNDACHVVQVGWAHVINSELVEEDSGSILLKLPAGVEISQGAADVHGITHEMLEEHGVPREGVLRGVHDMLKHSASAGIPIVGSNLRRFDLPVLALEFKRLSLHMPEVVTFDPCVGYKAMRLGLSISHTQTPETFISKVASMRVKGLKFGVDACCEYLGLEKRGDHDALGDCILVHRIMEGLRPELEEIFYGARAV